MEIKSPYVDKENTLIKSTFKGNKELLVIMRNLFFGLPTTDSEKDLVKKTFVSEELRAVVRNRFLPTIGRDTPLEMTKDMWTGFDLIGSSPEVIRQTRLVRDEVIKIVNKALALLENPNGQAPVFAYTVDIVDPEGIYLTARNQSMGLIAHQLNALGVVAEAKSETPAQVGKRLEKDSTQ